MTGINEAAGSFHQESPDSLYISSIVQGLAGFIFNKEQKIIQNKTIPFILHELKEKRA